MKCCIWLIAILLLAAPPPVASADSTPIPPRGWTGTYQVVSPDGRFVLVMLNGSYTEPDASVPPDIAESNRLLLRYDRSGLYSNEGTTIPHWTMPYIPEIQGITLSSDGHHLVVWGGWAWKSGTYREHAFSIYQDGQESARYTVRDLVAYPEELPHTVSYYQWMAENSLDDSRGVLVVRTLHDETYTFDLSTGSLINGAVSTAIARNLASKHSNSGGKLAISTAVTKWAAAPDKPPQNDTKLLNLTASLGSLASLFLFVHLLSAAQRRKRAR